MVVFYGDLSFHKEDFGEFLISFWNPTHVSFSIPNSVIFIIITRSPLMESSFRLVGDGDGTPHDAITNEWRYSLEKLQ